MAKLLGNFHLALLIGLLLLIGAMVGFHQGGMDKSYWVEMLRLLHVWAGILWIGLLYYFNFVQIPTMPAIPAELKPAIGKHIAPNALFYFRWGAAFTVLTGLILAWLNGYEKQALMLQDGYRLIGTGMWLGIIMFLNVWVIIWPNQKKALGIVTVDDAAKAKAGSLAMMASRTNLILSLPMLYCMIMGAHRPI